MKAGIQKLYTGFANGKAALVALVCVVYLALVAYSGGSLAELALFWLALAAYVVLPGLLLARVLKAQRVAPGFFGPLALLLGTGFFAVLFCLCKRLGWLPLLWVLPPLLAAGYLVLLWRERGHGGTGRLRARLAPKALAPSAWLLVLLAAFLVLVYAFGGVVKNGRPGAVGDVLLNQDLLWNTGNAESFILAFPPQDIRFAGVRLHYHYLTELLAGGLCQVTGISAYNVLAFYLQPPVLCALVYCLYRFGRLCWGGPGRLKALVFTFSFFLFGCASLWKILPNGYSAFGNSHITHLLTNINSVATSVVYLCIFTGLFLQAGRQGYRMGPLHWLLLAASFWMLSFAKGPLAGLVVVAVVLTLLVGLPLQQTGWRGMVLGVVLGGIFALVYSMMYASGANDSMAFSLYGTLEQGYFANILAHFNRLPVSGSRPVYVSVHMGLYLVQAALMVPAAVLLYLRGLLRDIRHFKSLSPMRLLANAMALGGMAAFFLFRHPAMSQVYFAFGGIFFLYWLAVDNLELLRWPKGKTGGKKALAQKVFVAVAACLAAVGIATSGFLYIHHLGSGARQLLRNLGVTEKHPYDIVMNADDEAAAAWLRQNSDKSAVFATNRIHTGARLEGISNLYSALSGRQAFMEGFQYAKTNMGVPIEEIERRLAVNEALFHEATSPDEVLRLMEENGIDYLLYTTQMGTNFAGYHAVAGSQLAGLVQVFESETVKIYQNPRGGA